MSIFDAMETKGLQQGNIIKQIHLNTINVVLGVKPNFILTDCKVADGDWVTNLCYKGITLNEEWLVKFSFVHNNFGGYEKSWKPSIYTNMLVTYRLGKGMGDIGFCLWENGYEIKNSIEFVHELQNIWYSLTRNEELKLIES